jgi:hypothetical protein
MSEEGSCGHLQDLGWRQEHKTTVIIAMIVRVED